MKVFTQYLITIISFFGIIFIITSFNQGSFDISVWTEETRNLITIICIMGSMIISAIFAAIYLL